MHSMQGSSSIGDCVLHIRPYQTIHSHIHTNKQTTMYTYMSPPPLQHQRKHQSTVTVTVAVIVFPPVRCPLPVMRVSDPALLRVRSPLVPDKYGVSPPPESQWGILYIPLGLASTHSRAPQRTHARSWEAPSRPTGTPPMELWLSVAAW